MATGPALGSVIEEVQGVFPHDAALQQALAQLALAGFDRAAFSLPETAPPAHRATPEQAAANPDSARDREQIRTMTTGMAGTIGAMAAAAATVATGGVAAVAIGAAAAGGLGAGLLAHATNTGVESADVADRDRLGAEGRLVLAVCEPDAARQQRAIDEMLKAGATRAERVQRVNEEITATGWTG